MQDFFFSSKTFFFLSSFQASSCSLVLDVGEDQLVLLARPSLYHLNVFHPYLVDQESSVAHYNISTQVLHEFDHLLWLCN